MYDDHNCDYSDLDPFDHPTSKESTPPATPLGILAYVLTFFIILPTIFALLMLNFDEEPTQEEIDGWKDTICIHHPDF
jgi:hypothetical protein